MDFLWILFSSLFILIIYIYFKDDNKNSPPLVPGLPLIGVALEYKRNAADFLLKQKMKYGGVFTINLSGFKGIIVADPKALTQIVMLPEEILSTYDGLVDFGFKEVLGFDNIFYGAQVQREVVKLHVQPNMSDCINFFAKEIYNTIKKEIPSQVCTINFFNLTRKIILRACVCYFIDKELINRYPLFIEDFHAFQEDLEDAVAKSTILPSFISSFWTKKVESKRIHLIAMIKPIVEDCIKQHEQGKKLSSYLFKIIECAKKKRKRGRSCCFFKFNCRILYWNPFCWT